jgi:uncharacterized protein
MVEHTALVIQIADHVQNKFAHEGSGHDWWHIYRVWMVALRIAEHEDANREVVSLGALLHDIADHKFHGGDSSIGPKTAQSLLIKLGADSELIQKVVAIVEEVTFKGAGVPTPVSSIEAACVQDADRLDAMGAIGIARAFAYGGSKNRLLHDPNRDPQLHDNFEAYKNDQGATTNHFYEKLLLLKDRMQTAHGKFLAEQRHGVMEDYLKQFFAEWEGRR